MNFRRSSAKDATASPRTRHNGAAPVESPRPPHAATVTPDEAFAAGYRYDPGTVSGLLDEAVEFTASAEAKEQQARELLAQVDALFGEASRLRVWAADRFRLHALAELDAETPQGAAWPSGAPQVPQEPAPIYHFSDRVSFWPPCGARTEATWQTESPGEVTCPGCREHLAALQSPEADADLLHGGRAWHPDTRAAQDDDTVPMRAVRTCVASVERDGVFYLCSRDEGHDGAHFSPRIGEFSERATAVAR